MNKKTLKVLKDIQKNAPSHLLKHLIKKEKISPATEELLQRALQEEGISEEKKKKFKTALDSGIFSKEVDVIDEDVQRLYDEYYTREINKAIAEGKLPPAPALRAKLFKKVKQKQKREIRTK